MGLLASLPFSSQAVAAGGPGCSSSRAQQRTVSAPALSVNGRYVAFASSSSNLVAKDTNRRWDVFVRDRRLGTTKRVSVSSGGTQSDKDSKEAPAISANGRFVAFTSDASNLVSGDTNRRSDVFVRDRRLGTTERVSVASNEHQGDNLSYAPAISASGRFVVFSSDSASLVRRDTNGVGDVFVRDRWRGSTRRVSVSSRERQANSWSSASSDPSLAATISWNGRYVAFTSLASNLVPRDTNRQFDVFVRDRRRGTTQRMSVSNLPSAVNNESSAWAAISGDGESVALTSWASNLVRGDTNPWADVFFRRRQHGPITRVSVTSRERQSNGLSAGWSAVSGTGRFIAFPSRASNLAHGDTNATWDVFVRDRRRGTTTRVSVGGKARQANASSASRVAISGDGRYVAFASAASDLVRGDTNGLWDVFVRDRRTSTTHRISVSSAGNQAHDRIAGLSACRAASQGGSQEP